MSADNPFAPSDVDPSQQTSGSAPLYSEAVCMVTTFFATPVGAAPLLMINASRTGQNPMAVGGIAVGLFVLVVAIGMAPIPIPGIAFTLVQVFGIRQLHRSYFENGMLLRKQDGVEPAPWLHAAVLCLTGFTLQIAFAGWMIYMIGLDELMAP